MSLPDSLWLKLQILFQEKKGGCKIIYFSLGYPHLKNKTNRAPVIAWKKVQGIFDMQL